MKAVRIALWASVAVALVAFAALLLAREKASEADGTAPVAAYGAPFAATLVTPEGPQPFRRADMLGRPHAIFFGFTHCPDVCPTTLYEAGLWLDALGARAEDLDVYFVTVDPERDTAAVLSDYLRPFDERIRAITGSPDEIARMAKGWNVHVSKVPLEGGGYNVDHTASTFLMRADGSLQGTIAYGEDTRTAVAKLRRLAGG